MRVPLPKAEFVLEIVVFSAGFAGLFLWRHRGTLSVVAAIEAGFALTILHQGWRWLLRRAAIREDEEWSRPPFVWMASRPLDRADAGTRSETSVDAGTSSGRSLGGSGRELT